MPDKESPAWSGLPVNIEILFKEKEAVYLIDKLWELKDVDTEGINPFEEEEDQ